METELEYAQASMGFENVGEEIVKIKRRHALPIHPCGLCKKPIVEPYLSGSSDAVTIIRGQKVISGTRLKLEPEPVVGGEFFVVGKIAHRARPEDMHPSLLFYMEHQCIAERR